MKLCDNCGAKNATRAQFCSTCGAPFRIVDVSSSPSDSYETNAPRAQTRSKRNAATVHAADEAESLESVEASRRVAPSYSSKKTYLHDEQINAAAADFRSSLWAVFLAGGRLLLRLVAPLFRWLFSAIRDSIVRSLSSPESWDPRRPPNFIYWAVVQFLVFRLPCAIVGLVYAVLASAARQENAYAAARDRAETAKNWLLFDLCAGIVVAVFKNLVFKS